MGEAVTIQMHPGLFQSSASTGAKALFTIENHVNDLSQLTYPLKIWGTIIWYQGGAIPAGTVGNVAMSLDAQGQYAAKSAFPSENILPYSLKSLGMLEFFPDGSHRKETEFNLPKGYRSGDVINFSAELNGNFPVQIGLNVTFEANADINLGTPPNLVFNSPYTDNASSPDICNRSIIPVGTSSGTKVRVHISSLPDDNTKNINPTSARIGIRDGQTSTFKSNPAPVALTFATQPGLVLGRVAGVWSDLVNLNIAQGDELLVEIEHFNGGSNNHWSLNTTGGYGAYFSSTSSGGNLAMQGPVTYVANRAQVIDAVQLLP